MILVNYADLEAIAKSYLLPQDLKKIKQAYLFAKNAHQGQKRKSGENYIHHPLAVAKELALLHTSPHTIMAGLLHDVLENSLITNDDLIKEFNQEVAKLVAGVTKLDGFTKGIKGKLTDNNYKKLFLATADDIRVIIIKLADRIHNIRTLDSMPLYKQIAIAQETIEVYCSIAGRLSLYNVKRELEETCFKYISPKEYKIIKIQRDKLVQGVSDFKNELKKIIYEQCKKREINVNVSFRLKTIYSLYQKLYKKGKNWSEIHDVFAIRIITQSIRACYEVLGMIHILFKPIPNRFKDFIALPKPNLYQSLHTTVTHKGFIFEAQIRTRAMDIKADSGIASHHIYKQIDDANFNNVQKRLRKQLPWLNDIRNYNKTSEANYMEDLTKDILNANIYILTPDSKIIMLPKGSTVIDFAYKIHSFLGDHFNYAIVNGEKVDYDHILTNGSVTDIKTMKKINVKRKWLSTVATKYAHSKIIKILHKIEIKNKPKDVFLGKRILSTFININYHKNLDIKTINTHFDLNIYSLNDLYQYIGKKDITVHDISYIVKLEYKSHRFGFLQRKKIISDNTIKCEDFKDKIIEIGNCCKPIPGDYILGVMKKNLYVTAHRMGCLNIERNNTVNISWRDNVLSVKEYLIVLDILVKNNPGIINSIISILANMNFNVLDIKTINHFQKDKKNLTITLKVKSGIEIRRIISNLQNITDVLETHRHMR